MAAYIQVAVLLTFGSSLAGAAKKSGLLLHRSRVASGLGFTYNMKDPVAQTLLTLDSDHNGRIEPNEIADYARAQGMDAAAATEEFSSIDSNGDGVLDSKELQLALGTASSQTVVQAEPAPSAQTVLAEPAPPAQLAQTVLQEQPQEISQEFRGMPAYADPIAPEIDGLSSGSSNKPSPTLVSAMNAYAQNVAATPQLVSKPENTAKLQDLPPVVAQQTAVIGGQESNDEILADDSRQAALTAAKRVSDQLLLEESEERQARDLDRQAADIRSQSIALAKQTAQDALDAGAKAAHKSADDVMARITKLEDQAERAEVKAAALSAKSKMEMEEASTFMAEASKAMQTVPDKRA